MSHDSKEPDALDRWFIMQRRKWWRRWRWLVILFVALFVVRVAYEIFNDLAMRAIFDDSTKQIRSSTLYFVYGELRRATRWFLRIENFLWWPVAIGLASSLVVAQLPRGEMILPFSAKHVYHRLLRKSRQIFWVVLGICGLTIPLYNVPSSMTSWEFPFALSQAVFHLGILAGFILFITELQIALLIRLPFRNSRLPLYALPALICIINREMMQFGSLFSFTHISPTFPYAVWQEAALDLPVAIGHLLGVFLGIIVGCYWMNAVLKANSFKQWSVYFAAILVGQFLPVICIIIKSTWVARVIIPASAILRGVNIGNPLLGWTEPNIAWMNPYSFDWPGWSLYVNNLSAIDQIDTAWDSINIDPGMVFSPWLYIPVWAALLWVFVYFGVSLWVIIRGNNAVPQGFRGTWDESES